LTLADPDARLLSAAAEIHSTLDPAEVLQRLAAQLAAVVGASEGAIFLNQPGQEPRLARSFGVTDGPQRPLAPVPADLPSATHPDPARGTVVSVPLRFGTHTAGLVELRFRGERSLGADEARLLAAVAAQGMIAIGYARRFERLEENSLIDGVTGLHNRRYLDERLAREVRRASADGSVLSVLMLDLDHLTAIKVQHGLAIATGVVAEVGRVIGPAIGDVGAHGLFGGDEILVILPATPAVVAAQLAERIRAAIEAHACPPAGIRVTASIGAATAAEPDLLPSLVQLADGALYRAKDAGRNRVMAASPGQ
jgi:diguanylate cyclase (GGDEF)-like protein